MKIYGLLFQKLFSVIVSADTQKKSPANGGTQNLKCLKYNKLC